MRTLRYAVPALALAAGLLSPVPAHAATVSSTFFAGFMNLGDMPCTRCPATFASTIAVGSVDTTGPGSSVVTTLYASITVTEPLCTLGLTAPTGSAEGTMTLTGVNVTGSALPIDIPFRWTRAGTVAFFDPQSNTRGWMTFAPSRPCFGNWTPFVVGYVETS